MSNEENVVESFSDELTPSEKIEAFRKGEATFVRNKVTEDGVHFKIIWAVRTDNKRNV